MQWKRGEDYATHVGTRLLFPTCASRRVPVARVLTRLLDTRGRPSLVYVNGTSGEIAVSVGSRTVSRVGDSQPSHLSSFFFTSLCTFGLQDFF